MKQRSTLRTVAGIFFLLLLIAGTIWILHFRGTATLRTAEGTIFGTVYHIKYESAEALDDPIRQELEAVDQSLSVFNSQSTISRLNRGETDKTDLRLFRTLQKAMEVSEETDGAFDVTVMPLVNAWGFGYKSGTLPTQKDIDSLRQFVGCRHLTLKADSTLKKDKPGITIDLGAIAKGYGVDCVAKLLLQHDVKNFMVEIGGEVITHGRNPNGEKWKIGISKPIENPAPKDELQTVIYSENEAMATSGNYRNFYVKDGKKYAHTIDPKTGYPVQHSLLSATVFAPDCTTADAFATAFMVMGLEKAKNVLERRKDLKACLIYADENGKLNTYTHGKIQTCQ